MTISELIRCSVLCLLPLFVMGMSKEHVDTATIHIRIVSNSGEELGEPAVEIFESSEDKRNLATLFRGGSATGVPFGVYRIRVHAAGFWSAEREVRVGQSVVWVVMQLELGMGKPEVGLWTFVLKGKVSVPSSSTAPIWLRLVGAYSSILLDTKANERGDFSLSEIPEGLYVLMTMQGGKVLDTRPIKIPTASPVSVNLRGKQRGIRPEDQKK